MPKPQESQTFTRVRETAEELEAAVQTVVQDPELLRRIMRLVVAYGNASCEYGQDLGNDL